MALLPKEMDFRASKVSEQRGGWGRGVASLSGASALHRSPPWQEGVDGVPIELILVITT